MERDNLKYTNVVLERLAAALEEILRLVKEDQERMKKLNDYTDRDWETFVYFKLSLSIIIPF